MCVRAQGRIREITPEWGMEWQESPGKRVRLCARRMEWCAHRECAECVQEEGGLRWAGMQVVGGSKERGRAGWGIQTHAHTMEHRVGMQVCESKGSGA